MEKKVWEWIFEHKTALVLGYLAICECVIYHTVYRLGCQRGVKAVQDVLYFRDQKLYDQVNALFEKE